MLRYFVASLVAAMVLAGLVTSKFPTALMRYLAALALMVTAIHFSGIVAQWRYDGRIVGDRNEDWPAAVAWMLEELPDVGDSVVLCPGLIEDLELAESDDPHLVDYCLFPLNGIYRLRKKELIPLPTTRRLEVPADLGRQLSQLSAMGVIVRARPETVAIIQEKLLAAFRGGRSEKIRVEQRQWGFLSALILRRRP
jgi:hypothetical protein